MKRVALAAILVAATTTVASAETYLGLGLGTSADVSSGNGNFGKMTGDGRTGRLALGFRFGRLAIEGAASRYSMVAADAKWDSTQLAAALKYSLPLGDNFELFGRGGLQRTSLSPNDSRYANASGNGYLIGAGIEYRLNLLVAGGSIFVDYERASTTLTSDTMQTYDLTSGMFTAGVTLSL